MISSLLSKIGIPALVNILSNVLGGVDSPAAKTASKALGDLDKALTAGVLSAEQIAEANRHTEALAALQLKELETTITQTNESLRTEVVSEDLYVRRMRPTFGYLMAFTWTAQMMAITYIMVFRTEDAPVILQAADSLTVIWTMALSVLGIYVYKRSREKITG